MLKGLGDIGNLMKLQKEMKNIQKQLKKVRVQGQCADGSVKATVNGEFELLDMVIEPELVAQNDAKKIAKLVVLAVNDAVENMKKESAAEMAKLTGGMNFPGMG